MTSPDPLKDYRNKGKIRVFLLKKNIKVGEVEEEAQENMGVQGYVAGVPFLKNHSY